MWWAQTSWSSDAPGIAPSFGYAGVTLSGSQDGPPSPPLGLAQRGHNLAVTGWYWLDVGRIPPTGCEWDSLATDMTTGSISGLTRGGINIIGPQPLTNVYMTRKQRVFSGTNQIAQDQSGPVQILGIADPNSTGSFTLPQFGVFTQFPGSKFDFSRTQQLGIELSLNFRIWFRGDGRVTFNVTVALPQFEIESTL